MLKFLQNIFLGECLIIRIRLSRLLGERRWTQAKLARRTKVRPSTIGDYYHELAERVNLKHLSKICKELNCQISDILEYVPDKEI